MKITAIKKWLVDAYRTNLAFVKIETDEGLHGYGEASIGLHENAVMGIIDDLNESLVGRNPLDIESLCHDLYRDSYWRSGPVLTSALAGLEMACWDIKGKNARPARVATAGRAVPRPRAAVMPTPGSCPPRRPKSSPPRAREAVARGWKALKWDPFGSLYRDITRRRTAGIDPLRGGRTRGGGPIDRPDDRRPRAIQRRKLVADCRGPSAAGRPLVRGADVPRTVRRDERSAASRAGAPGSRRTDFTTATRPASFSNVAASTSSSPTSAGWAFVRFV